MQLAGIPGNLKRLGWLSALPTSILTRGLDPKIFATDDFGSSSEKFRQGLFYGSHTDNLQELFHQLQKPEEPNEIQLQRLKARFPDVREHFDNPLFSWSSTGEFLLARCGIWKNTFSWKDPYEATQPPSHVNCTEARAPPILQVQSGVVTCTNGRYLSRPEFSLSTRILLLI